MKALLAACCLIFLTSTSTLADIAKPKPPEKVGKTVLHTSLEIVPDAKAYEARLQISESDFKSFQASLEGGGNTTIAASIAQSPKRTIIAGLLMFLSVSVAGVLLARSSSFGRKQKTIVAVIMLGAFFGVAAIVTRGNAGPPPSFRWRNLPAALAEGKPTLGSVNVEIVPDDAMQGRTMRLIIPLKKQNGAGEEE